MLLSMSFYYTEVMMMANTASVYYVKLKHWHLWSTFCLVIWILTLASQCFCHMVAFCFFFLMLSLTYSLSRYYSLYKILYLKAYSCTNLTCSGGGFCLPYFYKSCINTDICVCMAELLKYNHWLSWFLQSGIELFVNRLDSVESVLPYEYTA